jgi:hypothetical protein
MRRKGIEMGQYKKIVQRFSFPIARHTDVVELVTAMLAACVVTMDELSKEQLSEVRARIDEDKVRVIR